MTTFWRSDGARQAIRRERIRANGTVSATMPLDGHDHRLAHRGFSSLPGFLNPLDGHGALKYVMAPWFLGTESCRNAPMTYCLAIAVDSGLVFVSDSRPNAGVDRVSTYSKMHRVDQPGRQFVALSAGNLATTQSVIAQLTRDLNQAPPRNLIPVTDMADAADHIGELCVAQQTNHGTDPTLPASLIIPGQLEGEREALDRRLSPIAWSMHLDAQGPGEVSAAGADQ